MAAVTLTLAMNTEPLKAQIAALSLAQQVRLADLIDIGGGPDAWLVVDRDREADAPGTMTFTVSLSPMVLEPIDPPILGMQDDDQA